MNRCGKILACIAGALALNGVLRADNTPLQSNPYALIVSRNIFSLNPPPPVDTTPVAPDPGVKIMPNGIMSIFGQWQVLFKTSGGQKPGDQSYMLAEGERQDDIEVVKIDNKAGVVTFNNHGSVQKIPLSNSTSSSSAAVAGGFNNNSGRPGLPTFTPGGAGRGNVFINRSSNRGGQNINYGNANPSATPAVSTGINYGGQPATQTEPVMNADDQEVLIAAQHAAAEQDGDPVAQIFPPTKYDKDAGATSNLGSAPPPAGSPPSP